MKAEIITIGDEILIGQIVDTNSAWISRHLNLAGIEVYQITSVHDDREHILKALDDAGGRADLVLVTGGLGPTRDDLTKAVLCEFFHTKLEFHQPTFDHIIDLFKNRGIPLSRLNREQAMVPATCTVIPNINGTAPGMWFEHNGTIYVSMPGVPFEMETIVTGEIIPRLTATGKTGFIHHKTVLTQGIPESLLSEIIEEWENQLPPHIRLAYLPSPMAVKLRLSAYGDDPGKLERDVEEQIRGLLPLVGESVYGYDNDTLAMAVGRLLLEKNATLSVAESCTGGNIAHLITLTPGSSKWFKGSLTAYSNEIKTNLLNIPFETLRQYGAVSRETATGMALGIREVMQTGYSIATTGIAGPDGGSEEKPVGTVWIAVSGPVKFFCEKFVFDNNRERNIIRASQTALQLLRRLILQE